MSSSDVRRFLASLNDAQHRAVPTAQGLWKSSPARARAITAHGCPSQNVHPLAAPVTRIP